MRSGRFDIIRFRAKDVTPLEVWNLAVSGGELWRLLGSEALERRRTQGAHDAQIAAEFARITGEAVKKLRAVHDFDAVFAAGGLTDLVGFRAALANAVEVPVTFAKNGQFAFELGGRALLGDSEGVVVDVGQTAVKAVAGSKRSLKQRPATLPPLYIGKPRPEDDRHIEAAIDLIGSAFSGVPAKPAARANVVLALPCPVGDTLEPGGCTYGWESAKDLVPRIFANLEARGRVEGDARGLVLNDAELAAESGRALGVPTPALILTLGFGPGGALLSSTER